MEKSMAQGLDKAPRARKMTKSSKLVCVCKEGNITFMDKDKGNEVVKKAESMMQGINLQHAKDSVRAN